MTSSEVFKQFNTKLVKSLPMKDVVFLAELNTKDLFSGGLKAKVKAIPTATEAADCFLDNKIEQDLINGNNDSFLQLLSVMEEYSKSLKVLAMEIKGKLKVEMLPVSSNHEQPTNVTVTTPIIDIQPSSQSIDLLHYAIFTCIATGYNVKYQWTIGSGSFPSKVTGINTNTLVIPDIRSSDDSTYTCTISNDGGSVTSNPAKLTVTGLPEVTVYPSSQSVEVTQPVKFTTTVSGVGKENFSYQWRHNREDINGETSNTLTIDSVTKDDVGTYECVVKNEYRDNATSNTSEISMCVWW